VLASHGANLAYGPALASLEVGRIVGVFTPPEEVLTARSWIRQVGRCRQYRTLQELLEDENAEGVVVLSSVEERAEHAASLLTHGKHGLVEAPVAMQSAVLSRLQGLAQQSQATLVPAQLLRYEPAARVAQECLENGEIGEPRELRCEWSFSRSWEGHTAIPLMLYHILETLDLSRWWLGDPVAISADMDGTENGSQPGAIANIIVQHPTSVSVHHVYKARGTPRHERYVVTGSRGTLDLTGPASGVLERTGALRLTLRRKGQTPVAITDPHHVSQGTRAQVRMPYKALITDFIEAIWSRRPPRTTLEDALAAVSLLEAAQLSSREGVKVQLPALGPRMLTSA